MFQVLVVDDEPTAVEFICSLVSRYGKNFAVMGTAGNGQECIDRLRTGVPDVVLTDVKMPVMDGITLARRLRDEYPEVVAVVVSGYQEFEYVRSSLQNGVFDYLLKPLTPSAFMAVFEKLDNALTERLRLRRNRMLVTLSKGGTPEAREMRACFPDALYDCVLVRRNGLPRRFAPAGGPEIYWQAGASLSIFGRDERERICLRPAAADLESYVSEIMAQEAEEGNYVTAVATRQPFAMDDFASTLQRLYRTLDLQTVLGRTQAVYLSDAENRPPIPTDAVASLRRLEHFLQAGPAERARAELHNTMLAWDGQGVSLLWLEQQLRHILYLSRQTENGPAEDIDEYLLDDAFAGLTSMEELYDYMAGLLFPEAIGEEASRLDTPEAFARIAAYVTTRFAEPLNLADLSYVFNISQSYLSKMFRKHEHCSFNTYLTRLRMEYARRLLREDRGLRVKDIAGMAGYPDPFYFSRSFRAYTGMSPSDYTASQSQTEKEDSI